MPKKKRDAEFSGSEEELDEVVEVDEEDDLIEVGDDDEEEDLLGKRVDNSSDDSEEGNY